MANIAKISWWQWLPVFRWRIVGTVEAADEIPKRLPRNGAVLVGPSSQPKWIVFNCPCRSGHRIMLNADKIRWPYWSSTVRGPLSILPSIDFKNGGQRCHYFIRKGRIEWVR